MTTPADRIAAPAMPSDDDVNKRVYLRLPRPYPVEVTELAFPIAKQAGIETTCCDISSGGLCVECTTAPFEVGAKCQLRVRIPMLNKFSPGFFKVYENDAEQYFLALAEVAWIKPARGQYLMGFKFVNVDNNQSQALTKLIEKAFTQEG